jgi:DNA-binding transcriptional regulator YiaG
MTPRGREVRTEVMGMASAAKPSKPVVSLDQKKLEFLDENREAIYERYESNWIYRLRNELGLSVKNYAHWIGCSTTSIYAWQKGRTPSKLARRAIYQMEHYFFPNRFGRKDIF